MVHFLHYLTYVLDTKAQDVHNKMFYSNAYPANKDANSGLVSSIKLLSLGIIGAEGYIVYTLISHLYEYITTVHREPDVLMMICAAFIFLSAMKIVSSLYGYHLSTKHTDRTPENHSGMQSLLKITTVIHTAMTSGLYYFLEYHIQQYEGQTGTEMDADVKTFIDFI